MTIRPEIEKIVKKTSISLPRTCNLREKITPYKAQCSNHQTKEAGRHNAQMNKSDSNELS